MVMYPVICTFGAICLMASRAKPPAATREAVSKSLSEWKEMGVRWERNVIGIGKKGPAMGKKWQEMGKKWQEIGNKWERDEKVMGKK